MRKKHAAPTIGGDAETHEELVGVLTAISIVSRRLAHRLALLENAQQSKGEIEKSDEKKSSVLEDAN